MKEVRILCYAILRYATDIIIKNVQIKNVRLRKRVSYLNKRIVFLESNHIMLEQYGRRNNIEITGIPDTVQDMN